MNDRIAARSDDGTTAVIVASLCVALLGMGALVIDISALHAERRELQNGADAAALAVAADCGLGACGDVTATAQSYGDANAEDDTSTIESVELDEAAGTVSVTTRTREPDGGDLVPFGLANILGKAGQAVRARASAVWGFPGGARTIPLIMSICEWDLFASAGLGYQVVFFHDGNATDPGNCAGPAGQDISGGFGWLDVPEDDGCFVETSIGAWIYEDPGASASTGCTSDEIAALIGQTTLVPIFEATDGLGANGRYLVKGYAVFEVLGFKLGGGPVGSDWNQWAVGLEPACRGDERCLAGNFTDAVWSDQIVSLGGPDMGVVVVKLTG